MHVWRRQEPLPEERLAPQPMPRRWSPLPLRLMLGAGFLYHGVPKLFSATSGAGRVSIEGDSWRPAVRTAAAGALLVILAFGGSCARTRTGETGMPTTEGQRVDVSLSEYAIEMPASVSAGPTSFVVHNRGAEEHGFEIVGQGIERRLSDVDPGEMEVLEVDLERGNYQVICPIGDHDEHGMSRILTVQ